MPLYHIHGLSVNVLASAMSGSSVVCTPGYKGPDQPTQWLASGAASWYSAVPTMHQGIVEAFLSLCVGPFSLVFLFFVASVAHGGC